jgi:predicted membrane channel-forming protein YqfA (hemolysin III family)
VGFTDVIRGGGATATRNGNILPHTAFRAAATVKPREETVNGLIYLVGLIVVILFILSFLGLR